MEQRLQPIDYLLRRGRAACDADSYREQILQGTRQRAGRRDNSSAEGAIAKRCNNAWLRHRLISREQCGAHVYGPRSSDKQYISVAGRGGDRQPEPGEVVVRAGCGGQLVLAAVT